MRKSNEDVEYLDEHWNSNVSKTRHNFRKWCLYRSTIYVM